MHKNHEFIMVGSVGGRIFLFGLPPGLTHQGSRIMSESATSATVYNYKVVKQFTVTANLPGPTDIRWVGGLCVLGLATDYCAGCDNLASGVNIYQGICGT